LSFYWGQGTNVWREVFAFSFTANWSVTEDSFWAWNTRSLGSITCARSLVKPSFKTARNRGPERESKLGRNWPSPLL
jgi:hypothetical protein